MRAYAPVHDGKSEAIATALARAGRVGAITALEEMRQVFLGNADAAVAYAQVGAAAILTHHTSPSDTEHIFAVTLANADRAGTTRAIEAVAPGLAAC
jgi:hypothetical protein